MIKRILTAACLVVLSLGVIGVLTPAYAGAAPKDDICEGVGAAGGGTGCQGSGPSVEDIVKTVVIILSWIVGVAAVVMIIIGGLRYVTSGGDSNSVNSAKNTVLYAVIGLAVAALAQVIVKFVLNKL